jgi:hypothetical protein
VARVLILGYSDGATDGVLQLGGGPVYRFDWSDEVHNPDGCDTRSYILRPLADDALDQLATILAEYHQPKWPAWLPIWQFPTPEIQADVTARVDAILATAGEPEWEITAADTVAFATFDARPVAAVTSAVG